MQNRYRYFVSDYDMKQYVKTFFQRLAVLILEHTQDFAVAVTGAIRVKGLKIPKPSQ